MMDFAIQKLIEKAAKTAHCFKDIEKEAEGAVRKHPTDAAFRIAKALYASEVHQARMPATFILGMLSAQSKRALSMLRKEVGRDDNWRVQEVLAKAFDRYYADIGYEKALPVIRSWLKDRNPNVRRAVSEGLRIWASRDYFKNHPEVAVGRLAGLKDDESDYVRTSAGNALRDISKKHPALVKKELAGWKLVDKRISHTYRLAAKMLR